MIIHPAREAEIGAKVIPIFVALRSAMKRALEGYSPGQLSAIQRFMRTMVEVLQE